MGFICGLMTILGVSALVAGAGVSAAGVAVAATHAAAPCFKKGIAMHLYFERIRHEG